MTHFSQPRCGNHDGTFEDEANEESFARKLKRVRRASGGHNRWDTHRLSFEVQNEPYTLSKKQVRRAFRTALRE